MTAFLSAVELDDLRVEAESSHTGTCQIQRLARVSDNQGGTTDTWGNQGSAIPCRYAPAFIAPREQLGSARLTLVRGWKVYVAWDVDVRPADRLVLTTTRGSFTVQVVEDWAPRNHDIEQTIEATEID